MLKPNTVVINTPNSVAIWSKEKLVLPGETSFQLDPKVADRILSILMKIPNINRVTFPSEVVNELIGFASTEQTEEQFKDLEELVDNFLENCKEEKKVSWKKR